jgi:deubiquitinase DESI2
MSLFCYAILVGSSSYRTYSDYGCSQQPGRLSSVLWTFGTSLLHSGVVINGKEYAYGGHDKRGVTGVYWTHPKTEPPGGTFRTEIAHGLTFATQTEIDSIIQRASIEFDGSAYNILTRNCNHFTSYLCQKLTGRPGPGWLNRAATIGVALPCVVPRDWVEPPDFETADGELLDDDSDLDAHEGSSMLRAQRTLTTSSNSQSGDESALDQDHRQSNRAQGKGKKKDPIRDSSGRPLPASERAPL